MIDPHTERLMMGAAGAGSKSTYVDDVFSTYVWKGNETARTIPSGVDNTEGALVWVKSRNDTHDNQLVDTERGANNIIYSNKSDAQSTIGNRITGFANNGFNLGAAGQVNGTNAYNYVGWNFRKQKGFFDIVTYTGTGSARTIDHLLGCVPGCIMVKKTSAVDSWVVYHSGMDATSPEDYAMNLDNTAPRDDNVVYWNDTAPTSTVFSVGTANGTNQNGETYVAYLFAGAHAEKWSSMWSPASGSFDVPVELSFNGLLEGHPNRLRTSGNAVVITMTVSPAITIQAGQSVVVYGEDAAIGNPYGYNGTATVTIDGTTYTSSSGATHTFNTSGQLTQITYVNNSSSGRTYLEGVRVNGDLLTDGSFFVNGNPNYTAGEESKFGEDEDQSLVKCGNYKGTGSTNGPYIHVGWEPQWILIKNTDLNSEQWWIFDCIRGVISNGQDASLMASANNSESTWDLLDLTSTGFKLKINDDKVNGDGHPYIYIAIRRSDGYVGKPAEAGTDAFAMDTGATSSTIPNFDSGFPVDWAGYRNPSTASSMWVPSRLTGPVEMKTSGTNTESSYASAVFDSNVGWNKSGANNDTQSWMWKRGQGCDVVTYMGNGIANNKIRHSLSKVPEMIWVKNRDDVNDWCVYHKGLNSGTNPQNLFLRLNTAEAEEDGHGAWNDTAPTSIYFTVGSASRVNGNNHNLIAYLFASVEGISKVGSYTGSSSELTITTGFNPRFVIIKNRTNSGNNWTTGWFTFDTTRGWAAGNNDKRIRLNDTAAQSTEDWTNPISTGFTINANSGNQLNNDGEGYIYYSHA